MRSSGQGTNGGSEAAWMERVARHRIDAIGEHCSMQPLEFQSDRFWFLRHGQTQGNHLRIFQHADIELNETGVAQARHAAALLAQAAQVKCIRASTMRRAWQTAEILAGQCTLDPVPEPRLRERWFGDLVGTSSASLNWSFDPPGGEPLTEFVARTRAGLQAALDRPDPTLLIAHGGTLYVLAYSLGVELREELVNNATPLLFERNGGAWAVEPVGATRSGEGRNFGW